MRFVLCLLLCLLPSLAQSAKRVALIIGNDSYLDVAPLQKAVADAKAIAGRLEEIGFETLLGVDLKRRDFNLLVSDFTAKLEPGDTAFVFFAGHGVEIDGENLLLPTDIGAPENVAEDFIASEAIALSKLLDRVRRTGARTTLAIVDACRDNPFANANGRSIGRSRGLGRVAAPEGTFVMFSAGAGQQALDRLNDRDTSKNSVFTRLLLPKLDREGLELRDLMSELRLEVRDLARTQNHAQFPAYYDELLGDFYFRTAALTSPASLSVTDASPSTIRQDFTLAREIGSASALRAFLAQYASSEDFSIALAKDLLAKREQEAASVEMAAANPLPKQPDAKRSVEKTKLEEREIIRATQQQLARLGCRPGGADGVIGRRTRQAFADFLQGTRSALDDQDFGSQAALDTLRNTPAPACKASEPANVQSQKPNAKSATSSGNIAFATGSWTYSARCPLFIRATGSTTIRKTGANTFVSSGRDNLGHSGQMTFTVKGNRLTATGNWGGFRLKETGTIAADGRSYKTTTSVGCKVSARKL